MKTNGCLGNNGTSAPVTRENGNFKSIEELFIWLRKIRLAHIAKRVEFILDLLGDNKIRQKDTVQDHVEYILKITKRDEYRDREPDYLFEHRKHLYTIFLFIEHSLRDQIRDKERLSALDRISMLGNTSKFDLDEIKANNPLLFPLKEFKKQA